MKKQGIFSVRTMCILALMCAMQIVLSRFASINIGTWLKIGFSFLPIALSGYLYGAGAGCLVGAVSDVVGALLFPNGSFFPGFTVVSALGGAIYGLWLHGHEPGKMRSLWSALTVAVVCNILLNTVCLCVTGLSPSPASEGFRAAMTTRVIKNLIQAPVNAAMIFAVARAAQRLPVLR